MRVIAPAPREPWREVLARDPHALPEHAPEWIDAMVARGAYEDASRLYEFSDGRRFVLPLVRRRGPSAPGGWYGSYPTGWGIGGLAGAGVAAGVVAAVVDDLRSLDAVRVTVRPDPLQAHAWAAVDGPGITRIARRAHVIDLSGGVEARGADYAKGTRFHRSGEGGSSDITLLRRLGNGGLNAAANVLFRTRFTDLCYGYNAFWRRILPLLDLPPVTIPGVAPDDMVWGDGFEIETLLSCRAAAAGLTVAEVPSHEHPRLHGDTNLRTFVDGARVLRTIIAERISASRRYGARPGAVLRNDDAPEVEGSAA